MKTNEMNEQDQQAINGGSSMDETTGMSPELGQDNGMVGGDGTLQPTQGDGSYTGPGDDGVSPSNPHYVK